MNKSILQSICFLELYAFTNFSSCATDDAQRPYSSCHQNFDSPTTAKVLITSIEYWYIVEHHRTWPFGSGCKLSRPTSHQNESNKTSTVLPSFTTKSPAELNQPSPTGLKYRTLLVMPKSVNLYWRGLIRVPTALDNLKIREQRNAFGQEDPMSSNASTSHAA